MHDHNGHPLSKGAIVLLPCRITDAFPEADVCNINIQAIFPTTDAYRPNLTLNSRSVFLAKERDGDCPVALEPTDTNLMQSQDVIAAQQRIALADLRIADALAKVLEKLRGDRHLISALTDAGMIHENENDGIQIFVKGSRFSQALLDRDSLSGGLLEYARPSPVEGGVPAGEMELTKPEVPHADDSAPISATPVFKAGDRVIVDEPLDPDWDGTVESFDLEKRTYSVRNGAGHALKGVREQDLRPKVDKPRFANGDRVHVARPDRDGPYEGVVEGSEMSDGKVTYSVRTADGLVDNGCLSEFVEPVDAKESTK